MMIDKYKLLCYNSNMNANHVTESSSEFTTTVEQQGALGLPAVPATYPPQEFVKLIGLAQLAHDTYADSAAAKNRKKDRLQDRIAAGVAESVVVGVLNKVVELGIDYDAAVQAPHEYAEPSTPADYEPQEMTMAFSPNMLVHYQQAAARQIEVVRQAQEQERSYEQMPGQAS
jgi:hypothetical protein